MIRVTTQIAADYILPIQTAIMVIRDVANGIFGQNYDVELDYKEKNTQSDNENDEIDDESVENDTGKKSKRRMDYTYVMPLSRTVRRYLEDANLLNLKYLADRILSNPDEAVVTLGLDDTTKAAGNKVHDVQTTHFTFKGPESSRECFTTGLHGNASHAGKEAAKQVTGIFSMMATLADCTVSEIKEAIDFFMVDRAADANLMLKELGIEDENILKCTAHICLCCDAVIDKSFRQQECESGTNKLLDVSAGTQHFCSPSTSIFTIASIALPKLLSLSHSAHSVSLFSDFTQWCADNEIELMGFKGFQANGFGRIASNAKTFLEHEIAITEFLEEVVDDSDNKLVTACAHYIRNRWFKICCEVYVFIAELIIFSLNGSHWN